MQGVFMKGKVYRENLISTILFLCAASSIGIVLYILYFITSQGFPQLADWFLHGFGVPGGGLAFPSSDGRYELTGFMFSTLYVGIGGTLIGAAIGIPCAIYLAEFSDSRIRSFVKPTLEMLSGFPSIVLGIVGFTLISNSIIQKYTGGAINTCMLAGWIVLGILSLPAIATISEDSLRAVPHELREASLGLGATKWQTSIRVLVPNATSGILTSLLLAFGSAIGETMAVIMVIGPSMSPPITLNPLVRSNTLTMIVTNLWRESGPGTSLYTACIASGVVLFILTAAINLAIRATLKGRKGKA
jgi:phosphate ABC transporter permease protein PstC